MAENIGYEAQERSAPGAFDGFLSGIAGTLEASGTPAQRILCALMMAVFALARLPGGGYCAQAAMFAVLLRLGFAASAAFIGVLAGFVYGYVQGNMAMCSQLLACVLLWLSCALWARPAGRLRMAAAVLISQLLGGALHAGVLTGSATPLSLITWGLSAAAGAALCLLYDGAALSICHREELDGETRPLCAMAVLATVAAGLLHLPYGAAAASAMALYLTLEHAYVGGAAQAILCAGVLGGAVSLGLGGVNTCAMLLTGGFLAGEIKTRHRSVCAALMLSGMAAASALLGGTWHDYRLLVLTLPGAVPFLLLPISWRRAVTGVIERTGEAEMTQSEAIAVRCASMIHAWAHLYEDTAKMMQGLCAPGEDAPLVRECVQLLQKTSAAAHQVCERTLGEIRPDDEAYRRVRYALVRAGMEQVRPAYALRVCGRREVMLIKPEQVAASSLERLVSSACGTAMRARAKEGLLCTQAVFEQEPALALEIGAQARSRSGEEVAGDSYLSRALGGGRHVLALSDGMGSGVSAMQESHAALSLLTQSLRAGYTRAQALDVVNALMLMCTGREMYATMDLCVIDLHTGEAAFEKLAACPSYVVRGGEVRAIGADTLPVGVLPDVEPHSLRMTLREGDVILLITDGLQEAFPGGGEALREAIGKLSWLHPQAIGEKLIAQAAQESPARDDMTVLCARVVRCAEGRL